MEHAYTLSVKPDRKCITITGSTAAGVFYGAVSLISLLQGMCSSSSNSSSSSSCCCVSSSSRWEIRVVVVVVVVAVVVVVVVLVVVVTGVSLRTDGGTALKLHY